MKAVSAKQFYLFLVFFNVVTKFLYLPSILSFYASKDIFLIATGLLILDGCFLYFLLKTIKNAKITSFFALLQQNFNKKTKNLAVFLLFLLFFLKTIILILETNELLQTSFYTSFSQYEFFVLLVLLTYYVLCLPLKTLARSLQLLAPFFGVTLAFLVVVSLFEINLLNIIPVFESGFNSLFNAVKHSLIWFGNFALLFLFLGRVKTEKNFVKKSMLWYLFASIVVVVFLFCFSATFSTFGVEQNLGAYELLQNLSGTQSVSKLDWLFLILWSSALLFAICLFCYNAFYYFKELRSFKKNKVSAVIFITILLIVLYFLKMQMSTILPFLYDAFYVILLIQYGITVFLLIYYKQQGEKV